MVLEQLRVANVAPQRVHRLVTGHVHHLEDRSALGRCRCQEARPQRVTREQARVKASPLSVRLDDISHGSIRQPLRCHRARLVDGPEYRTCLDTRRIQPFQKSPGGACNIASGDRNGGAFTFPVGLAALDRGRQAALGFRMSATSRATSSDRRNAPAEPNSKSARSRRPREAEAAEADPGPHRAAFAHCCYGLGVPGALIHHFGERIESRPERGGADRGLLGHLTDADEGSSQGRMRWRWYSLRSCGSCDLKQLSQLFAT